MRLLVIVVGLTLAVAQNGLSRNNRPPDIDTAMMNATFRILGPDAGVPGKNLTGTGFLVGRPLPKDPTKFYLVAVTAAHVLHGISGDFIVCVVRTKNDDGQFERALVQVPIRKNGAPLWKEHPSADVAAFYIRLPKNHAMEVVPMDLLATDEAFEQYQFHPGDEVSGLGYPFGYELNEFGFPILRSGRIASYPLTPVKVMKEFYVDFSAFGGNSGGPVYISAENRSGNSSINLGSIIFRVVGIVTESILSPDRTQNAGITRVVHAQFIRETIALLPADAQP